MKNLMKFNVFGLVAIQSTKATAFLYATEIGFQQKELKYKSVVIQFDEPITPDLMTADTFVISVGINAVDKGKVSLMIGHVTALGSDMGWMKAHPQIKRVWKEVTRTVDET
jgi:hypothetical protein